MRGRKRNHPRGTNLPKAKTTKKEKNISKLKKKRTTYKRNKEAKQ